MPDHLSSKAVTSYCLVPLAPSQSVDRCDQNKDDEKVAEDSDISIFRLCFPLSDQDCVHPCYLILSSYMMSASFVSFILILSSLSSSMLATSPWSDSFFPELPVPAAPPEPPDTYDDPK